jgi:hypothetical protein
MLLSLVWIMNAGYSLGFVWALTPLLVTGAFFLIVGIVENWTDHSLRQRIAQIWDFFESSGHRAFAIDVPGRSAYEPGAILGIIFLACFLLLTAIGLSVIGFRTVSIFLFVFLVCPVAIWAVILKVAEGLPFRFLRWTHL